MKFSIKDFLSEFGHIYLKKSLMENFIFMQYATDLTISWRMSLSYRNQSVDLLSKRFDSFLYDSYIRHERVNPVFSYWLNALAHFMPLVCFFTPWKLQKTWGFFVVFKGYIIIRPVFFIYVFKHLPLEWIKSYLYEVLTDLFLNTDILFNPSQANFPFYAPLRR